MEQFIIFVKVELLVVAVVLYFLGDAIKKPEYIKDKYIPMLLGAAGIAICGIWVIATCDCNGTQNIAMAVFTSIVQGVLVAGLSTYVNQILKQLNKDE